VSTGRVGGNADRDVVTVVWGGEMRHGGGRAGQSDYAEAEEVRKLHDDRWGMDYKIGKSGDMTWDWSWSAMSREENIWVHSGMIPLYQFPLEDINSWWLVRNLPASSRQPPGLCRVTVGNCIASGVTDPRVTAFQIPTGGVLYFPTPGRRELHALRGD